MSQEREQLFLVALARFSDGCEAPNLEPACPYRRTDGSQSWCLEECEEELADYRASLADESVILGPALHAKRRRSVKPLRASQRPFDIREQRLADEAVPLPQRRMAALLHEFIELIELPPPHASEEIAERSRRGVELARALDSQGIDPWKLIRAGHLDALALSIVLATAIPLLAQASVTSEGTRPPTDARRVLEIHYPEDWWRALAPEGVASEFFQAHTVNSEDANRVFTRIVEQQPRVAAWLSHQTNDDLLRWTAPTREELDRAVDVSWKSDRDARWIIERTTRTYLNSWSLSSLTREFEYVEGDLPSRFPSEYLRAREVPERELLVAIARRTASANDRFASNVQVSALVGPALRELRAGRRYAAAAIFDACRIAIPNDAEAHNNYGFCAIWDDPQRSLDALNRAATLGMAASPVNVANRMTVLASLGRATSALNVADAYLDRVGEVARFPAFLWEIGSEASSAQLAVVDDAHAFVFELAAHIADCANDADAATKWRQCISDRGATSRINGL